MNSFKKPKRIIVLDTNIPLIDYDCCKRFKEHMIAIPLVLLTEIDKFKKGSETINFNARKFARFLDTLPSRELFEKEGVEVTNEGGRVRVLLPEPYNKKLKEHFPEQTNDQKILNAAYCLSQLTENKCKVEIVLVSNDVNLRMSAKSLGLTAEDYKTETVNDVDSLNKNVASLSLEADMIQTLHQKHTVDYHFNDGKNHNNECFFLKQVSDENKGLAIYNNGKLDLVHTQTAHEIKSKNAEQAFALKVLLDPKIRLVTIGGKAGTGKTFIAIIAALHQLYQAGRNDSQYKKILYTRPTVSVGKDLGYTPGDVRDKLEVYMGGFYDNMSLIGQLSKNKNKALVDQLLKEEKEPESKDSKNDKEKRLALQPISLIRGRSITNAFFIVDEAQNLTRQEIKTIVTRLGENSKIVFLGDVTQIDHPFLDENSNGFVHLIDKMTGDIEYAHCFLKKGERSGLAERAAERLG